MIVVTNHDVTASFNLQEAHRMALCGAFTPESLANLAEADVLCTGAPLGRFVGLYVEQACLQLIDVAVYRGRIFTGLYYYKG